MMGKVGEEDGDKGGDKEDDIKPSMIEVELNWPKDLRDGFPVLMGHRHAHEQDRGEKVHAHELGQKEYDVFRGEVPGGCFEELEDL